MSRFAPHFSTFQNAILFRRFDDAVKNPCVCGKPDKMPIYRCKECFLSRPLCHSCILLSHSQMPFHVIEKWTGMFFMPISPSALGIIVYLGHYGRPCLNNSVLMKGRDTTVVHTNRIRQYRIEYCHCLGAPAEFVQLTQSGLFPTMLERPETAFTFSVLDDFHVHTLTSKKSLWDYYEALVRHTNKAFPHLVLVSISLRFPNLTIILLLIMPRRGTASFGMCRVSGIT